MLTKHIVYQLAIKHSFSMVNSRDTLWVRGPEEIGDLIVNIREGDLGYVLAITLPVLNKANAQVTGFRVYYDMDWKPVIGVNERGGLYRDAAKADERMRKMIQEHFMNSEKSWIKNQGYKQDNTKNGWL